MNKKKLVVLTGAGISAESGLKTFRDSDGLWEGYNVEDVATATAWRDRNGEPRCGRRMRKERRSVCGIISWSGGGARGQRSCGLRCATGHHHHRCPIRRGIL